LSGHTSGHRLPVFARKPAPIQATWIGYFNTTGLDAIDYIISDRDLIPQETEHLFTEKPLRLPYSSACYSLPDLDIPIQSPPALKNGFVTFGCFSNFKKHTSQITNLWIEILLQVPEARLILKTASFSNAEICDAYRRRFVERGIGEHRLTFEGDTSMSHYMARYNDVDIMLDTSPYNAATTCLQALWMGVPQVSLRGNMLVSRIGESLLTKVGLQEFVAPTPREYVNKAVEYAGRPDRLAEIRSSLRQTLATSPITNPKVFTESYEAALRGAWQKFCGEQGRG
jgi:predicted O-linked N-acetylglucosamine transferase (SPINDLY family)